MERSGQKIVEGAIAHSYHSASQADHIIWHAKIWCWQIHQERFSVETYKVAGAIKGRKSGKLKKISRILKSEFKIQFFLSQAQLLVTNAIFFADYRSDKPSDPPTCISTLLSWNPVVLEITGGPLAMT